ncbi:MAG TPA: NAD-dependent epimerase/dehydratase family protein, partial [Thermoplasmatales archaeon]|nr:NAD-dependent epimerase/dehydratase family protein [Thermoplasmatales archaeon]
MNVLVTGGSGFIGRYLVDELVENGYKVSVLTRQSSLKIKGVKVFQGDITKPETFSHLLKGVDAVFHNAAYAMDWGRKSLIYRVNVEGTRNVAEVCKEKGVERIVYTSSAGVYGFPNTNEWIREDSPKKPLNAYQKSKFEGENVLRSYSGLHVSIVRPPLVFGAGAKATRIVLSKMEQSRMPFIGDGNNYISIVHPRDVAQCLRLALEKDKKGEEFNVVSFITTIREFFEEAAAELKVKPPEKHIPYPFAYVAAFFNEFFTKEPSLTRFRVKSLGTTRRVSCEKAKKVLGYKPRYDLKSTVEDMVS